MMDRDEHIKTLAGANYIGLTKSYSSALALLQHVNPEVREAAILECAYRWKDSLTEEFAKKLTDLMSHDQSEGIRIMAVNAFGGFYRATRDAAASRVLADIVMNDNHSGFMRFSAYLALCEIDRGIKMQDYADRLAFLKHEMRGEDVLTDKAFGDYQDRIDWDLVNRFKTPGK
jgi:hypothetical protein